MHNCIRKIAIAGSGNVAWHLATALKKKDFDITGIWSRSYEHASLLAGKCSATVRNTLSELTTDTDLILIAVPDGAIEEVVQKIGKFDGIVVHTAGSVGLEILNSHFARTGVFYPLQTFSKERDIDLQEVPFFLESSAEEVMEQLKEVAVQLSSRVFEADTAQRLLLHVAAVFAGNYSNLMYIIGNEILATTTLPSDVIHPLMLETTRKAIADEPLKVQTGPARRNDINTIKKHLEALAPLPEYAELYQLLAQAIRKKYK